jgi:hypothetical protein
VRHDCGPTRVLASPDLGGQLGYDPLPAEDMVMDAKIKRERLLRTIVRAVRELATLYLQEGMTSGKFLIGLIPNLQRNLKGGNSQTSPNSDFPGGPPLFIRKNNHAR